MKLPMFASVIAMRWFSVVALRLPLINSPVMLVIAVSLVVGLLMVLVFRAVSDQKAIRVAKDQLKAHLLAVRLFQDQLPVVMQSYGRILRGTARYIRLAFKPLLFVILPITLLIVQLDRYLGWMPLQHAQPFLVRVRAVSPDALNEVSLELPKEMALSAPAVHLPADSEVVWRVVAEINGTYNINVAAAGETFSKQVVLARDLSSYLPFLSSAQIRGPKRRLRVGEYSVPLGKPEIKGLRRGTPFWHWLGKAGIFCSVIRVPVTFPPEKFPGVLLSGMCVPDLKGSQGTFCFCTTRGAGDKFREGGVRIPIERHGSVFRSYIPGPEDPLATNSGSGLRVDFELRADLRHNQARIEVDSQKFTLKIREYSEWIPVKFKAGLGFTARGICRFYVKQLSPEVEVYVTPVNIDPGRPDLPISHPVTYSIYLAKLFGPYATLGLAEDTWALNEEVLDDQAFLAQCYANHEDRERMLFDALDKTPQGLCVCVFDTTDRVQHMFWRYLEDDHPAARKVPRDQRPSVIEDLYRRMDDLIGRVMDQIDHKTLLLAVSDHGFKSFTRCVNLNAWLHQNGYLALNSGKSESGDWFQDVDWSRTLAYTMGLNGLYLNLKGREREGIVEPGTESETLKNELRTKLNGLVDPASGGIGITGVFDCDAVFAGPYVDNAPDLIVGYGAGFRASWDSVTGRVTTQLFEDNTKAWSGDHCIDPRLVPGVLFCNRKIAEEKPAIVDVAPTILKLFGLGLPTYFDGKPWTVAPEPSK